MLKYAEEKNINLIFTASCRFYQSFKDQYESTSFCALFYLKHFKYNVWRY